MESQEAAEPSLQGIPSDPEILLKFIEDLRDQSLDPFSEKGPDWELAERLWGIEMNVSQLTCMDATQEDINKYRREVYSVLEYISAKLGED